LRKNDPLKTFAQQRHAVFELKWLAAQGIIFEMETASFDTIRNKEAASQCEAASVYADAW